jgi:hypothetical protein
MRYFSSGVFFGTRAAQTIHYIEQTRAMPRQCTFSHRHSLPQGIVASKTPQTHAVHYVDANEPELVVSEQFLIRIESIFGPQPSYELHFAVNIFKDFVFEARKLQRLDSRGEIYNTPDLLFAVRDLLLHLPL